MTPCPYCDKSLGSKVWLTRHIKAQHPDAQPTCSTCGDVLIVGTNWDAYLQRTGRWMCRRCEQPAAEALHRCSVCGVSFQKRHALSYHIVRVHPDLPPTCSGCNAPLTDDNRYAIHKRKGIRFCKECWGNTHTRATSHDYNIARQRRQKEEIIAAYGGKCQCCGETTLEFLTVDHINNDGAAHRRQIGRGLYGWLKKHGFPQDNFQLLCMNCNFAKGRYGRCPHQK